MPTRPKKVSLDTNAVNTVNAVRNNNSVFYKDYVPPITDISELKQIGKIIMDLPALQNEFLNALVNRIAMVRITSKLYDNPWSRFKKGIVDYGETIEEIYVDLCRVYEFDVDKAENELFKRSNPDVRAAFHTINFMKFYKITVSRQMLYRAFLSAQGMDDLISKIMESVYTSANYDEFLTMKYLLACTILNGRIYPIEIPEVNVDNAKAIVTAVKANSNRLTFPSRDYNPAGVFQHTPKEEQNIIINSDFDALMDVNVLASAFNMSKAEFDGKRIMVDSFGSLDKPRLNELFKDDKGYKPISDADLAKLDAIPMVVTDDNFWMIFDNLVEMRDVENGQITSTHHPFTRPRDEDLKYLDTDPTKILSYAYDIVINGYEAGGGSLRIYDQDMQKKVFNILGFSDEDIARKFGYFVKAFEYGTPPHGGIAFGLERLSMIICGTDNIRDVIAFPKNLKASCPMSNAPSGVDPDQLEDLGIKIVE